MFSIARCFSELGLTKPGFHIDHYMQITYTFTNEFTQIHRHIDTVPLAEKLLGGKNLICLLTEIFREVHKYISVN